MKDLIVHPNNLPFEERCSAAIQEAISVLAQTMTPFGALNRDDYYNVGLLGAWSACMEQTGCTRSYILDRARKRMYDIKKSEGRKQVNVWNVLSAGKMEYFTHNFYEYLDEELKIDGKRKTETYKIFQDRQRVGLFGQELRKAEKNQVYSCGLLQL